MNTQVSETMLYTERLHQLAEQKPSAIAIPL